MVFGRNEIYNLNLISILDLHLKNTETISIDNKASFTITLPKVPDNDKFKEMLGVLKTLTYGDTVLVSGAVTKINDDLKVDFKE